MPNEVRVVEPGKKGGEVIVEGGQVKLIPPDWDLLLPGDAALTRRVKKAGPYWQMQEKKGRKLFSRGIWAPVKTVAAIRRDLEAERATPTYQKKLASSRSTRARKQEGYVEEFNSAVRVYLNFHPCHGPLAEAMAAAVTEHAVPVGSGTVARTQRIPLEERAEAAVIAWMRHLTTGYDTMAIPRIKGERRKVRRRLAKESVGLLERYRKGDGPVPCPLKEAIERFQSQVGLT